jgi:hypothetical protein
MWLLTVVLSLCLLGLLAAGFRPWRAPRGADLGVMSQQWLSEHRAGSR